MWLCTVCSRTYKTIEDVESDDPRQHNPNMGHAQCPNGHGDMEWHPSVLLIREIDATFDEPFQLYRNAKGDVVEEQEGWDYPCPKCLGPAELKSITAYHEHHTCLNCHNQFKVC